MSISELDLFEIFMPFAREKFQTAQIEGIRFAHYCSAESGLNILRSKKVFLRNSALMNDFSEVSYGLGMLSQAWDGDIGVAIKSTLSSINSNIVPEIVHKINSFQNDIKNETYLISLSEHPESEDHFGRLSMWRAYAQENGIALIMNNKPFLQQTDALRAYTSPVLYADQIKYNENFIKIFNNINENYERLKETDYSSIVNTIVESFILATQSTKHPSFKEEKEWRVIFSPTLLSQNGLITPQQPERVPTEILSLRGVPQRIYSIPFKNYPQEGFEGAEVHELIDRILIGPTLDSYAIQMAFIDELTRLNVPNPEHKVIVTGIPLRH